MLLISRRSENLPMMIGLALLGLLAIACQPEKSTRPQPSFSSERTISEQTSDTGNGQPSDEGLALLPEQTSNDPLPESESIKDTLQGSDQSANDSRPLRYSHTVCTDAPFGFQLFEACLEKPAGGFTPNSLITIRFGFPKRDRDTRIDQNSVMENFKLIDQNSEDIVDGKLFWRGERELVFDPTGRLPSNHRLQVRIENRSGFQRPRLTDGRLLQPLAVDFVVGEPRKLELWLDETQLSDGKPTVISTTRSDAAPPLWFKVKTQHLSDEARLSLRFLGDSGRNIELCNSQCQDHELRYQIKPQEDLHIGVNTLVLTVEDQGLRNEHHHSLIYGDLLANERQSSRLQTAHVLLETSNSLPALETMLGRYINGRFRLKVGRDDEAPVQSFNELIAAAAQSYQDSKTDLPLCMSDLQGDFDYLPNLGPFCDITLQSSTDIVGGLFGSVNYTATADIYVTNMEIIEDEQNAAIRLNPKNGFLDINLDVNDFKGELFIAVNVKDVKYLNGIPIPGTRGIYTFNTEFRMSGADRRAIASTSIDTFSDGQVSFRINDKANFDLFQPRNGRAGSPSYFDTSEWTDHVIVDEPSLLDDSRGLWSRIVNAIILQAVREKVPVLTPRVVNGIAGDMIEVVASQTLNNILEQLRRGLTIPSPDYLPPPLNQISVSAAGKIAAPMQFKQDLAGAGPVMATTLQFELDTLFEQPRNLSLAKPTELTGQPALNEADYQPPKPSALLNTSADGAVLVADFDLLNQLIFKLWQQGVFDLRITEAFTEKIEEFAVFDPIKQSNGKEVLLAEFIPKLLGGNLDATQYVDENGDLVQMAAEDSIELILQANVAPFLRPLPETTRQNPNDSWIDRVAPPIALEIGEFLLTIRGRKKQPGDTGYTIASLKLALQAASNLSFRPYSNPYRLERFSGVGALSLTVDDSIKGLDFSVQAINAPNANPFGLDIDKLERLVVGLVDDLFIPLTNDALRELPLTGLRTCGLELDAAGIRFIRHPHWGQQLGSFLAVTAPLKTYDFQGVCDLLPDTSTPLPPLPPIEPEDPNNPDNPDNPGPGGKRFDMSFDQIPFKPGQTGSIDSIEADCKDAIFFDISCAKARVIYQTDANGQEILDERGRKIYEYTEIKLYALVSKSKYNLRADASGPNVEGQFLDFDQWDEYVAGRQDDIVMKESFNMEPAETPWGTYYRHYVDYETNSPKASGFIPIRNVTMHRLLETPYEGAEISTEFFVDASTEVEVPTGRQKLSGSEGLDFHIGNIHVLDCSKHPVCQKQPNNWLVIYDSKLRPEDTSIPEEVLPYLKRGLNAILQGMFP